MVVPDEERASYLTPEFLQRASAVDPVAYLPQLKNRGLRLQQIMDDPETPSAARDKIAAATQQGQLVQYPNQAAHREAWKATGLTGWIGSQFGTKSQLRAVGNANGLP